MNAEPGAQRDRRPFGRRSRKLSVALAYWPRTASATACSMTFWPIQPV